MMKKLRLLFPKPGQRRFYNRLMLYNTVIFIVVIYLFAFILSYYAVQLDRMKQIQQNMDVLKTLSDYYESKLDEFYNHVLAIYGDQSNYQTVSKLLEAKDDQPYESDAFAKLDLSNVMKSVIENDNDIVQLLIYKNLTNSLYVYSSQSRTFERVGSENQYYTTLKDKVFGRNIYGAEPVNLGLQTVKAYGIAGTLSSQNIRQGAGSLLILYNVQSMNRILQSYAGNYQGRFFLVSKAGEVIFDSAGQYAKGAFPYLGVVLSGKGNATVGNEKVIIQTDSNSNPNFIGVLMLPEKDMIGYKSGFTIFIFTIFTVMAVICTFIYLLSGSITSRRVGALKSAMKRIGTNNLSYRIKLRGGNDEFEEIATRFNEMCDELQVTIDREYVNEIKKKNAELGALQAGINPHFLYNTLEAIRVRAYDDGNNEVAEMIVNLANLYRSVVHDMTFIPIHKEINVCKLYLAIFSLRYNCGLDFDIDVEPGVMDCGIPKNLLQPIVENYFVHGIHDSREDNRLVIEGRMQGADIVFRFEDNGRGMDGARLREIRDRLLEEEQAGESSYGLANVHQRIRLVYGERYGLWIDSQEEVRTEVRIRIKAMSPEELKEYMGRKNVLNLY